METAQKKGGYGSDKIVSDEPATGTKTSSERFSKINASEIFTNGELYFLHKKYKRAAIRQYLNL
jgi:hypothetical protein